MTERPRIGVIGYGYIGAHIVKETLGPESPFELAFVYNRTAKVLEKFDPELRLADLDRVRTFSPDIIVECAHPDITINHGKAFLQNSDYMPFSLTALADDSVTHSLHKAARENGTRLLIPAGALVGGDELLMRIGSWKRIRITFTKHPDNIDFSESEFESHRIRKKVILYEGSVREVARRYPRNVNTMVTCALITIGLDKCQARLVCDPDAKHAFAEIEAWDRNGGTLRIRKKQPAIGVSGTEMADSAWYSLQRAAGQNRSVELV